MVDKRPLVIGVGGLLEQDEKGRIQDLLEKLQDRGCVIYSVRFNTICRDGNTILCPMSDRWVSDFDATVEAALGDERVDPTKIGVIASSIGATIADYAISSSPNLSRGLGPYATISPLAKLNPKATPYVRKMMEGQVDFDVSFAHDRERGIKRVIPYSSLGMLAEIDTNTRLAQRSRAYNIKPLTIIGAKDDRCDIEASKERHRILGGTTENLLVYNEGHGVPAELTEKPILDFMSNELGLTTR